MSHEFHLQQRPVDGHRRRGVELLPDHEGPVALHPDRHDPVQLEFVIGPVGPGPPPGGPAAPRPRMPGPSRRVLAAGREAPGPGRGAAILPGNPRVRGQRLHRRDVCRVPCLAPVTGAAHMGLELGQRPVEGRNRSSAAASALITGPREDSVSSTRSFWADWRGLRSTDTSTSTLMVFWSSLTILSSLAVAYSRKRSWIPVRRPRKMMSTWETPFDRSCGMTPARPTWSSSPHPPAEGFAACCHYYPSPGPGNIWSPGGAGLTSKPHRDRSTTSRLTWAVSPAAGIGLPSRAPRSGRGTLHGATTDPGGCHIRR